LVYSEQVKFRRLALAVVLASGYCACSAFSGSDDGADTPPADRDAEPETAVADSGNDAIVDAGDPGVLIDDPFETPGLTCSSWEVAGATAELIPDAGRSGSACRVCSTGGGGQIERKVSTTAPGNYVATAYFRLDPTSLAEAEWQLETVWDAPDGADVETSYQHGKLTDSWTLGQSTAEGATPRSMVSVRIFATPASGGCYFVDDVQLTREP
jgi:hypothetical protein